MRFSILLSVALEGRLIHDETSERGEAGLSDSEKDRLKRTLEAENLKAPLNY
jgi:hypothetical protein